jgi:hypothetical protein
MIQQILALIIIAFFLARLFWQKKKAQISQQEFSFWLIFWLIAAGLITALKWIDAIVANLGFSGKGIEILLYLGIAMVFYLIFKLRVKIEKIERNITKIIREIAIRDKQ